MKKEEGAKNFWGDNLFYQSDISLHIEKKRAKYLQCRYDEDLLEIVKGAVARDRVPFQP